MDILRNLRAGVRTDTPFASTAVASLALNLTSKLVLLATSILLARWLGVTEFGIYASSAAVLLLVSVPAQLGLPTLVVRLVPAYTAQKEWSRLHGLLRSAGKAVIYSALLVSAAGFLLLSFFRDYLPAVHVQTLQWTMAILPFSALLILASSTLRGLHRIVTGQLVELLIAPALFLILILAFNVLATRWQLQVTSDIAMAVRFVATSLVLIMAAWLVVRILPREIAGTSPSYDRAMWVRSAAPLVLLGGLTVINTQTDVLMLAALVGVESAGVYQAAARGAELVALSLLVVGGVVQPTISRLYTLGEFHELQRLLTTSARVALAVALPIAIVLSLFSKPILRVVYGPEFQTGAVALTLLCAAQIINVGAGLVGHILVMTGHGRDALVGMGLGAGVNVLLNATLIPFWGITGAAVATGVGLIVWNIFLMFRVRRRTRLESGVLRSTP